MINFTIVLFLISSLSILRASDTVIYFGKIKSNEKKVISIQLKSKEILRGPYEQIENLDESDLGDQYFKIKKDNLKNFNLIK